MVPIGVALITDHVLLLQIRPAIRGLRDPFLLRLVACGCIWLRGWGFSGFDAVWALRLAASVLGGRWQNVGKARCAPSR